MFQGFPALVFDNSILRQEDWLPCWTVTAPLQPLLTTFDWYNLVNLSPLATNSCSCECQESPLLSAQSRTRWTIYLGYRLWMLAPASGAIPAVVVRASKTLSCRPGSKTNANQGQMIVTQVGHNRKYYILGRVDTLVPILDVHHAA